MEGNLAYRQPTVRLRGCSAGLSFISCTAVFWKCGSPWLGPEAGSSTSAIPPGYAFSWAGDTHDTVQARNTCTVEADYNGSNKSDQ